jgi:hypothetical protein
LALQQLCTVAARDIAAQLKSVGSQYRALIPGVDVEDMIAQVFRDVLDTAPQGTKIKNGADWEKWELFCGRAGVSSWRGDLRAHAGGDPAGFWGECFLQAAAFIDELRTIQPRSSSDPAAKPASVTIVDSVRRIHKYFGVTMAPPKIVNGILKSANVRFIKNHGQEAFDPSRKEPFTNPQLAALTLLPEGTKLKGVVVDKTDQCWRSIAMLIDIMAQSGMRLADALNLNAAAVVFEFKDMLLQHVDHRVTELLTQDDWALLKPGKSKSDPLGQHWAPFPVYLPIVHGASVCAAKKLYEYYSDFPTGADQRQKQPMFVDNNGKRLTRYFLTKVLWSMFEQIPPSMGLSNKTHSWHSFRIHLACALKAAGADNDRIKSMVRWVSDDSLRIYARDNRNIYGDWLRKASMADVHSVSVANLPTIDDDMAFAVLDSLMGSLQSSDF